MKIQRYKVVDLIGVHPTTGIASADGKWVLWDDVKEVLKE